MSRIAVPLAALLVVGSLAGPAEAGCIKGAAVGAVAGHFAHHHAVLGAIAGCAIGHHLAVKAREQKAAHPQPPAPAKPDHT
jgi:outer membrane lipoprotein SlyB